MRLIIRWLRKEKLRFLQGQRGIGLLETVIAVAILGAIGVSLLTALNTNARATRTLDEQVTATNLATAYFELIEDCEYAENYPKDQPPLDSIIIPPGYDVDIRTEFSTDAGETWFDDYNGETLQKVIISISREGDGKPVLSMCTFRTKWP